MQEFILEIPAKTQMRNYAILGVIAIAGTAGVIAGESAAERSISVVITALILFFVSRMVLPAKGASKVTLGDTMTLVSNYGRIDIAKNDVVSAALVDDLKADPGLHPTLKTNAVALGDHKLGWFVLKNGKKAFVMSSTQQVVALELKDKYVMMAPKEFDRFVQAVTAWCGPLK